MPKIQDQHICEVIVQQGIKTGMAAMQECGMQPEFAAHLMLMANGTGAPIILRAGKPPNYDRPSTPKPGYIRTKSSKNQGFYNGYFACESKFSRIEISHSDCTIREVMDLHRHDRAKLHLPITNSEYLHGRQLSVNLNEINFHLSVTGDLRIQSYDHTTGELKIAFKPGKGHPEFHGIFIIKLDEANAQDFKQIFSRPWNKPSDEVHLLLAEKLSAFVPADIRSDIRIDLSPYIHKEFKLYYKDGDDQHAELKPAKVLCKTPQSFSELITELKALNHPMLPIVAELPSHQAALIKLGAVELEKLYDQCGIIMTCDWDGLAIGYPIDLDSKYLTSYNTFITDSLSKTTFLIEAANDLFEEFKRKANLKLPEKRTRFDHFILELNFYTDIYDSCAVEHAGIITPFELLYQQLSNYAYRQSCNRHFGEIALATGLYEIMHIMIEHIFNAEAQWIIEDRYPNKEEQQFIIELAKLKLAELHEKAGILYVHRTKITQHLIYLLSQYLNESGFKKLSKLVKEPDFRTESLVTHPDFDHNIVRLFQHGFDMRSPYGVESDGAWIMITVDGLILKGNEQKQLIPILLAEQAKLLRTSYFYISPSIDMRVNPLTGVGWGDIIKLQVALGQAVQLSCIVNVSIAHQIQDLLVKYFTSGAQLDANDALRLKDIIENKHAHKQVIPDLLIHKYTEHTARKQMTSSLRTILYLCKIPERSKQEAVLLSPRAKA